jgi:hypothetical protein
MPWSMTANYPPENEGSLPRGITAMRNAEHDSYRAKCKYLADIRDVMNLQCQTFDKSTEVNPDHSLESNSGDLYASAQPIIVLSRSFITDRDWLVRSGSKRFRQQPSDQASVFSKCCGEEN